MRIGQSHWRGAFVLFATVLFSAFPALASASGPPDGTVVCRIRMERKSGLLFLHAMAASARPASGSYTLILRKHSATGTSQTMQQGDVALRPGSETLLATTAVEAGAEGHLSASLTLDTNRGRTTCRFPQ